MKKLSVFLLVLSVAVLSAVDVSKYGAGEMKKPGRTFYASPSGSDKNDGKTLKTAFRSVKNAAKFLKAGDTLYLKGGMYFENEVRFNTRDGSVGYNGQSGKPDSPIRIIGMPGEKAVLSGAYILNVKKPGQFQEFRFRRDIAYDTVQEVPSGIELQSVKNLDLAKECPGTFFYDQKKKKLYVHFAALEQTGVAVARARIGLRIHGSYIHLENLHFTNYYEAIYMRMNMPYDKNKSEHNTIKNCYFYHNYKNGAVIDGSSWTLVTGCRGWGNTERGTFLTMKKSHDNLFIGNWFGNEEMTLRQRALFDYNYSINSYTGNPLRNHVIGNVMDNKLSYRGKGACPESIIKYNLMSGGFYAESKLVPLTVQDNLIAGKIGWKGLGWNLWDKDFVKTPIKFSGNVRKLADFKPADRTAFEALKLKVDIPEVKFPQVVFKDLTVKHIAADGAVVMWQTPECDGWGEVLFRIKGAKKWQSAKSVIQSAKHLIALSSLRKNTVYEYQAKFTNRRGRKETLSAVGTFKTLAEQRAPQVLEVGTGKLTPMEAGFAAIPGDTVKFLPGRHYGYIELARSGRSDAPITISGNGATLDGMGFYLPLVTLNFKSHIILDGLVLTNPESTTRHGVIRVRGGKNVTIRNCRVDGTYGSGSSLDLRRTEQVLIENNIFWRGGYVVILQGMNQKFFNNTVVDGSVYAMNIACGNLEMKNNIIARSCVDFKKRNGMYLFWPPKGKISSDGNVFWSPVKDHAMGANMQNSNGKETHFSRTLKEWQKYSGMDKNTIVADPLFVDYKNGDFRLKPGSPAQGKGANIK